MTLITGEKTPNTKMAHRITFCTHLKTYLAIEEDTYNVLDGDSNKEALVARIGAGMESALGGIIDYDEDDNAIYYDERYRRLQSIS